MKKKWTVFALILIAVGVYAYTSYSQNNKEEKEIEQVLSVVHDVNEVVISNNQKTIQLTGKEALPFIEKKPLVNVANYERKYGSYFEKEPKFTIQYKINKETLYTVELFQSKKSVTSLEIDPYLINEHLLVKWKGNNVLFSQHEKIESLIEYFNTNE